MVQENHNSHLYLLYFVNYLWYRGFYLLIAPFHSIMFINYIYILYSLTILSFHGTKYKENRKPRIPQKFSWIFCPVPISSSYNISLNEKISFFIMRSFQIIVQMIDAIIPVRHKLRSVEFLSFIALYFRRAFLLEKSNFYCNNEPREFFFRYWDYSRMDFTSWFTVFFASRFFTVTKYMINEG